MITDSDLPGHEIERAELEPLGADVRLLGVQDEHRLVDLCRDADALLVQHARVGRAVIEAMHRCKAIVRYGIGFDTIDLEAARMAGIPVCNVPEYCLDEVADHTFALLLALTRDIPALDRVVRAGGWSVSGRSITALAGKTMAVIGCGRIGRKVIARALPFGLRVLGVDPYLPADEISALGAEPYEFEAALEEADVVSLHVPLNAETRHLIDRQAIRLMRRHAVLINASRGGLVDTLALASAITTGRLGGAGLDVFEHEPLEPEHPLLRCDRVLLSPHAAYFSPRALTELRRRAAQEVARALRGEPVLNRVS